MQKLFTWATRLPSEFFLYYGQMLSFECDVGHVGGKRIQGLQGNSGVISFDKKSIKFSLTNIDKI